MSLERQIETQEFVSQYEQNIFEWMIAVIGLRWKIPLHEVQKWKWSTIKRHIAAWRYEKEKMREAVEQEE